MRRHPFLGIAVMAIVLRLPVFLFPYVNIDENEYAVAGKILLAGGLPYRDFLIYQPPVVYYLYAGAFALFRTSALWAPHCAVIGIVVATCGVLNAIGRRMFGPAAGWWTALCYAVFATTFLPHEMLGANCEVILLLPLCGACWCLVRSEAGSAWWGVLAGGLAALAFLTKYQAGIFVIPFAAYACLTRGETSPMGAEEGATEGRVWWVIPACFLCGWVSVVGSVVVLLAAAGVWPNVMEATTYILWYAKGPPQADPLYVTLKFFVRTALVAVPAAMLWWHAARAARAAHRYRWFALVWLFAGGAAVVIGGRIYFHYYYLVLPPLALLAGAWLGGAVGSGWRLLARGQRTFWLVWSGVFVASMFCLVAYRYVQRRNLTSIEWERAAVALREIAPRGGTLFVWGYCPQLYTLTGLSAATRFTTADYLTGRTPKTAGLEYDPAGSDVPSSWEKVWNDFREPEGGRIVMEDTSANIFPRAWEYLAADFAERLPDVIVDTAGANYRRYGRYPIQNFPLLHSVVTTSYTMATRVDGYAIYLRRSR